MLGLIGKYQDLHEDKVNFCTVHPTTNERINLQPWYVPGTKASTKGGPAKEVVFRPASQEDFKAILAAQGNTKQPVVGELPAHIAKVKQEMYDKAIAEWNKKGTAQVAEK